MRPKLTPSLLSSVRRSSDYPGGASAIDRFWRWVDRSGGDDACWPWIGANNGIGYGTINIEHTMLIVTHVSWVIAGNELGDDPTICHTCDNPPCCNPAHLFNGSRGENMQDALAKGRMRTPFGAGEANVLSILTAEKVREIRRRYREGFLGPVLFSRHVATEYGVSPRTIEGVIYGRSWRNVA